jgi:hypothetical protein
MVSVRRRLVMKRTVVQEEGRKTRFAEAYEGRNQGRLSPEETAYLLWSPSSLAKRENGERRRFT